MAALPAPLSKTGKRMLAEAEARIEAGLATFMEVGQALVTIRDGRLYREDHGTFEDYCRDRWGFTGRRARQLIDAAEIGTTVPVANEGQARALAGLPPEQASDVYEATKAAGPVTAASLAATRRQAAKTETVTFDPATGYTTQSGSDQSGVLSPDAAGPGDDQQGHEEDAHASDPAASPAPKVAPSVASLPMDGALKYQAKVATEIDRLRNGGLLSLDPERAVAVANEDGLRSLRSLTGDLRAFADRLDQALGGPRLKAVQ